MRQNFAALSKPVNAAKQAKSWLEFFEVSGVKLDEAFRQGMIARERELVPQIQKRIYELLQEQEAAAWRAAQHAK
jgi:hypothetical protein